MTQTIARYRMPDITGTLDDYERLQHRDLDSMPDDLLLAESISAATALSFAVRARPVRYVYTPNGSMRAQDWLSERLNAVEQERRFRRSRSNR
jgi:hypothetical protein